MKLTVNTSKRYKIQIKRGCLDQIGKKAAAISAWGAKAVIISDSNVMPLYGDRVEQSLSSAGFSCSRFTFPAGEEHKQLSTIAEMYEFFADQGLTRSDFLVALGGGVVGDMVGFAAATYLRGIQFIQVPTSLLAQIDSSVGGKTGVDLPHGKNLVGAFHQPALVLIDSSTLDTLPARYFSDGMAEAVKYGCIYSRKLFDLIAQQNKVKDNIDEIICKCVDLKRAVVERDELDTGERMMLNFGHTFGHALEKTYQYQKYSHGEAVGVGMVMMSKLGEAAGLTKAGTAKEIAAVLKKYNLPVKDDASIDKLIAATALDKKGSGNSISIILLREIGAGFIKSVSRGQLKELSEAL